MKNNQDQFQSVLPNQQPITIRHFTGVNMVTLEIPSADGTNIGRIDFSVKNFADFLAFCQQFFVAQVDYAPYQEWLLGKDIVYQKDNVHWRALPPFPNEPHPNDRDPFEEYWFGIGKAVGWGINFVEGNDDEQEGRWHSIWVDYFKEMPTTRLQKPIRQVYNEAYQTFLQGVEAGDRSRST
jgi:hypothetical protein